MRGDLLALVETGKVGLDPLVSEALFALASGASPTRKEAAGPAEVGAIDASDAG